MTQQEITKVAETMEVSTHAHETYDASGKHTMTEIRGQWAGLMACRVFEDLAVSDPQTFERSPLYLSAVRAIAETIIERIEHSMEAITDSGISTEPAAEPSIETCPMCGKPLYRMNPIEEDNHVVIEWSCTYCDAWGHFNFHLSSVFGAEDGCEIRNLWTEQSRS